MAILYSGQTGNWTAAGTWRVVDATSYLNSDVSSTSTTTSFVSSSTFTPGAITVEGIGVKILSRSASPTGTFSVRLAIAGVPVIGTTVTINVSDIPAVTASGFFWLYMKFAAPVLLLAATLYTVQVTSSTGGQVTLLRNATANNWSRALLTTTTAAPAAGDTMLISGEYTAATVNAAYTVTMDNTSATVYGTVANNAIEIGAIGTLAYGVAASTAYQLIVGGNINVGGFGTFTIGTVANPIPSTSSALLQFNCASVNQFQLNLRFGHTFQTCGTAKLGREILGANAIVGATTLTTATSTGWLNGDNICIAPTTASGTAFDTRTMNANAVGTSVTVSAGLTNAKTIHAGTEVEVINLTRNVRIIANSTTNTSTFTFNGQSSIDIRNTEFRYVAWSNAVNIITATSTINWQGCSFWDTPNLATQTIGTPTLGAVLSTKDCVFHNISSVCGAVSNAGSNPANFLWEDCWAIRGLSGTNGLWFLNASTCATFTRCRAIGGGNGNWTLGNNATFDVGPIIMTDCVGKCGTSGISIGLAYTILSTHSITGFMAYLNSAIGISIGLTNNFTFTNATCFSNTTSNVQLNGCSDIQFNNCVFYGGPTAVPTFGVATLAAGSDKNVFNNCTFGVGTAHSTSDIRVSSTQLQDYILTFRNCLFSSPTEISQQANLGLGGRLISARHDQTDGNHRVWKRQGTISADSTIVRSTGKSQRLTPLSATLKFESGSKYVAVKDGQQVTVGAWVRKSVIGDGATYNGNQPRLILKANPAVFTGTTDVVLATASGAAGAFEYLSGTCTVALDDTAYEVLVDCDGTAGWVNVDDWKISVTNQTNKEKYWSDGAPVEWVSANQGGGLITF
jgi:hypothetical protein